MSNKKGLMIQKMAVEYDKSIKQRKEEIKSEKKVLENRWKKLNDELLKLEEKKYKQIVKNYIGPKILEKYSWGSYVDKILEGSLGEGSYEGAKEYVLNEFQSFLEKEDYEIVYSYSCNYVSHCKEYIKEKCL